MRLGIKSLRPLSRMNSLRKLLIFRKSKADINTFGVVHIGICNLTDHENIVKYAV